MNIMGLEHAEVDQACEGLIKEDSNQVLANNQTRINLNSISHLHLCLLQFQNKWEDMEYGIFYQGSSNHTTNEQQLLKLLSFQS